MARSRRNKKPPDQAPEPKKPAGKPAGAVGKRIVFDLANWQSLDVLARERMMTFQELADEAFLDLLRKHGRPYDTRDAFKRSARLAQANENRAENNSRPKNSRPGGKPAPKSKRPAGWRARS